MNTSQFVLGVEEGLLTLKEVSEAPEVQRARLKYSRIRNWAFTGINGQKLPTVRIGGIRYTTSKKSCGSPLNAPPGMSSNPKRSVSK